jgi:hypothetical protein
MCVYRRAHRRASHLLLTFKLLFCFFSVSRTSQPTSQYWRANVFLSGLSMSRIAFFLLMERRGANRGGAETAARETQMEGGTWEEPTRGTFSPTELH